jgi:hypothetical protein
LTNVQKDIGKTKPPSKFFSARGFKINKFVYLTIYQSSARASLPLGAQVAIEPSA